MLLPPAPPKTAIEQQVADKRATLQAIETEMVAALEWEATTRHAAGSVRMDDRDTWDETTWTRYLAAAKRLEPDYMPAMRQLLRDIDAIQGLTPCHRETIRLAA